MAIRTTTIGSYPKPDYVPLRDWYSSKPEEDRGVHPTDPTRLYADFEARRTESDQALLDRGTQEVVREQDELGIDIPTDGEVRRDHYVYYHLRALTGFDFENTTEREMRAGGWVAKVPTVRGPVRHARRFLRHDWQVAQAATRKPVKMTVPGPLTIMGSTADAYYADERTLGAALGDALNQEIRDLAAAGCAWIQIDEPLFARHPDKALDFGIDNLARCLHKIPEGTATAVHVCCGYPAELDQEDYPKADPGAYAEIADALDKAPVDAVSLEDAHRPNDLGLLEHFARTSVILGVIEIASTRVENVDDIRQRLLQALEHIDAHRLLAGPDCGLTMLPHALAVDKLRNLVAAARSVG